MEMSKNSIGMRFVLLPGGKFRMGLRKYAEPIHEVKVAPFWMGQYEVTNEEFDRFKKRPRPIESRLDRQPVTRINWADAVEFCAWLSKKEGAKYRLPTEAEWEYAARGGLDQKLYPWGDDQNWSGRANFGSIKTVEVGSYRPNGFDLYDMAGNVAEFVSDVYDNGYYAHSPSDNPSGPVPAAKSRGHLVHVIRGGFFSIYQGYCGLRDQRPDEVPSNIKAYNDPNQIDGTGFRVVRETSNQGKSS